MSVECPRDFPSWWATATGAEWTAVRSAWTEQPYVDALANDIEAAFECLRQAFQAGSRAATATSVVVVETNGEVPA